LIGRDLVFGNVVPLLDLRADDVAVEEVTLPADAGAVGGTLADVSLPANVSVIAVIAAHGAGVLPARGETPLGANDVLLLLTQGTLDEEAVLSALGITPPAESEEA